CPTPPRRAISFAGFGRPPARPPRRRPPRPDSRPDRRERHAPAPRPRRHGRYRPHFFASSASIALTSSGDCGSTFDLNRPTTSPERPTRNFSKFQPISPGNFGFVSADVRNLYSGAMPGPLTTTLLIIG